MLLISSAVVANDTSPSTVETSVLRQSRLSRPGGPQLSGTFYRIKIGQFSSELQVFFWIKAILPLKM